MPLKEPYASPLVQKHHARFRPDPATLPTAGRVLTDEAKEYAKNPAMFHSKKCPRTYDVHLSAVASTLPFDCGDRKDGETFFLRSQTRAPRGPAVVREKPPGQRPPKYIGTGTILDTTQYASTDPAKLLHTFAGMGASIDGVNDTKRWATEQHSKYTVAGKPPAGLTDQVARKKAQWEEERSARWLGSEMRTQLGQMDQVGPEVCRTIIRENSQRRQERLRLKPDAVYL